MCVGRTGLYRSHVSSCNTRQPSDCCGQWQVLADDAIAISFLSLSFRLIVSVSVSHKCIFPCLSHFSVLCFCVLISITLSLSPSFPHLCTYTNVVGAPQTWLHTPTFCSIPRRVRKKAHVLALWACWCKSFLLLYVIMIYATLFLCFYVFWILSFCLCLLIFLLLFRITMYIFAFSCSLCKTLCKWQSLMLTCSRRYGGLSHFPDWSSSYTYTTFIFLSL